MNADDENIWSGKQPPIDPKIPEIERGPPEGIFLDLTNAPGEPLSWSESLEEIIGPETEE